MAENSKIEWTDHTFNPWVGCTKVSPACDHCYAEGWAKRTGNAALWQGERRRTTPANWRKPIKWDTAAAIAGVRAKVFCASLADVFDNQAEPEWRADLWRLIEITPNLDWLLLTKRPQNIAKMLPHNWGGGWPNVWLGTTVENQDEADRRIPHLLRVPATVHFLSCEPLLDHVDLTSIDPTGEQRRIGANGWSAIWKNNGLGRRWIDWVITGGESGHGWRDTPVGAFERIHEQCSRYGVACFHKQQPNKAPIPPHLMVRQFPNPPLMSEEG